MTENTETTYEMYRAACLAEKDIPLTRREWNKEGGLSYKRSKRKSDQQLEKKDEDYYYNNGWK